MEDLTLVNKAPVKTLIQTLLHHPNKKIQKDIHDLLKRYETLNKEILSLNGYIKTHLGPAQDKPKKDRKKKLAFCKIILKAQINNLHTLRDIEAQDIQPLRKNQTKPPYFNHDQWSKLTHIIRIWTNSQIDEWDLKLHALLLSLYTTPDVSKEALKGIAQNYLSHELFEDFQEKIAFITDLSRTEKGRAILKKMMKNGKLVLFSDPDFLKRATSSQRNYLEKLGLSPLDIKALLDMSQPPSSNQDKEQINNYQLFLQAYKKENEDEEAPHQDSDPIEHEHVDYDPIENHKRANKVGLYASLIGLVVSVLSAIPFIRSLFVQPFFSFLTHVASTTQIAVFLTLTFTALAAILSLITHAVLQITRKSEGPNWKKLKVKRSKAYLYAISALLVLFGITFGAIFCIHAVAPSLLGIHSALTHLLFDDFHGFYVITLSLATITTAAILISIAKALRVNPEINFYYINQTLIREKYADRQWLKQKKISRLINRPAIALLSIGSVCIVLSVMAHSTHLFQSVFTEAVYASIHGLVGMSLLFFSILIASIGLAMIIANKIINDESRFVLGLKKTKRIRIRGRISAYASGLFLSLTSLALFSTLMIYYAMPQAFDQTLGTICHYLLAPEHIIPDVILPLVLLFAAGVAIIVITIKISKKEDQETLKEPEPLKVKTRIAELAYREWRQLQRTNNASTYVLIFLTPLAVLSIIAHFTPSFSLIFSTSAQNFLLGPKGAAITVTLLFALLGAITSVLTHQFFFKWALRKDNFIHLKKKSFLYAKKAAMALGTSAYTITTSVLLTTGYMIYLADPHFLAEHVCGIHQILDTPSGYVSLLIASIFMVVGVALLVYGLKQHQHRKSLQEFDETYAKKDTVSSDVLMAPYAIGTDVNEKGETRLERQPGRVTLSI